MTKFYENKFLENRIKKTQFQLHNQFKSIVWLYSAASGVSETFLLANSGKKCDRI